MPALFKVGGDHRRADLDVGEVLVRFLADPTADDEQVRPQQRVDACGGTSGSACRTPSTTASRRRGREPDACRSASLPSISMWPSSVLGSSAPSWNTALPMPVPSVIITTTPLLVLARAEAHLGHAGGVGVVHQRSPAGPAHSVKSLSASSADPALVHVGRRLHDAPDDDAGEGDADRAVDVGKCCDDLLDHLGHVVGLVPPSASRAGSGRRSARPSPRRPARP